MIFIVENFAFAYNGDKNDILLMNMTYKMGDCYGYIIKSLVYQRL